MENNKLLNEMLAPTLHKYNTLYLLEQIHKRCFQDEPFSPDEMERLSKVAQKSPEHKAIIDAGMNFFASYRNQFNKLLQIDDTKD